MRHWILACLVVCLPSHSASAQTVTPPSSGVDVTGAALTLMEIVRETKDSDAKWRAIRALRDLRYNAAAPLLLECLKDDHHYVRANAARALGDMRIWTASTPLIDLLKQEKDGGVIEQTSLALTLLQAHEAVPVLKRCANQQSGQTLVWVLQAIGNLGSRTDVPFLAERLNSSSIGEQDTAARGIENLAKVDFRFPKQDGPYNPEAAIKRAKDWWEKDKSAFQGQ
jgi:HEAT repeat protein